VKEEKQSSLVQATWIYKSDVNGDCTVDTTDVRYVLKGMVGLTKLTEVESRLADMNNDSRLNSTDIRRLLSVITSES